MTNRIFRQFHTEVEQDMFDSIINETIHNFGLDVQYLPMNGQLDGVLGEYERIVYDAAFPMEMSLENRENFDNGEDTLEKFGIDVRQTFQFTAGITKFKERVQPYNPPITRPREGDLIYVPMDSSLYEITKVREYERYYRWGKLFTYNITCELFRYSGQEFKTGVEEIDEYNYKFSSEDATPEEIVSSDPLAANEIFEDEAADLLDFDETNPFGNPGL